MIGRFRPDPDGRRSWPDPSGFCPPRFAGARSSLGTIRSVESGFEESRFLSVARPRRVVVLVLPEVHVLDLAGPVQVLSDSLFGGAYRFTYCGPSPQVLSSQGLAFSGLTPLPTPAAEDLVLVPGVSTKALSHLHRIVPDSWLREACGAGARIASICSGAFVLARAGLLDGRSCTTHWELVSRLRA